MNKFIYFKAFLRVTQGLHENHFIKTRKKRKTRKQTKLIRERKAIYTIRGRRGEKNIFHLF